MGVLDGLTVLQLAGIGPGPFCAMMLADMGADVVRVDRPGGQIGAMLAPDRDVLNRSGRSVVVDLRSDEGREVTLALVRRSDVLIEGFRPGVTERLGVGPDVCLEVNPRLVYGRITGWGQRGPLAHSAGHDINYVAVSGALYPIGPAEASPAVPLSYIGDFGGGGMLLTVGVLGALLERASSGAGQVVDAAMVDGAALQASTFYGLQAAGLWSDVRGENFLDGAAPFYRTYTCADGAFVAVGAIEPAFYGALLEVLGLDPHDHPQWETSLWPVHTERFAARIATRPRDEWVELAEGTDACLSPVLPLSEAALHEHARRRGAFTSVDGILQPAPAPRFGRTPSSAPTAPVPAGADTDEVLRELGYDDDQIRRLRQGGHVG